MSYAKTQSKNSNGEESRPAGGQLRGGEADAGGDLPQVVVPGSGDHYDDHDQDPHGDQQDPDQDQRSPASNPDCCSVVLSQTDPIPTFRQASPYIMFINSAVLDS